MFYFVVRHLRWLARVPGFPQLFDALLLTSTCLFHQRRRAAMELLEATASRWPGVQMKMHKYGGMEFMEKSGRELGHIHGHGLLDVAVGREKAKALIAQGQVQPHHVFPQSKWVSFQLDDEKDVPFAIHLLGMANTPGSAGVAPASLVLKRSAGETPALPGPG